MRQRYISICEVNKNAALFHELTEKIADGTNGDVADDFYHRFKDDVKLMKEIGLDSFRFSLSWSRILPHGNLSGGVNQAGIKFYNSLINELIANGITPFVTLFHWDTPQGLDADYGSFLSPKIVDDYRDYVDLCFKEFGDRVKHWATMNEPNIFSLTGYTLGILAPGRCSSYMGNCTAGNSATEPYIVSHHLLLCHAAAVDVYKKKYQATQKGVIGITIATTWYVPINRTSTTLNATQRAKDFMFVEPVTYGHYPKIMRSIVGPRLPKFTKAQSEMLKGSYDFLGINYYTSNYAANYVSNNGANLSYTTDNHATTTTEKDGIPIGQPTPISSDFIYPKGLRDLVLYLKQKYNNPLLIVTENGLGDVKNSSSFTFEPLNDALRIEYVSSHIEYLYKSIKDGGNVMGYFVWSFIDDFEWSSGFTEKYGLAYVNYTDGLKRTLKQSALWYKNFLSKSE
ncbi:Beta-glucosidase 17-like protein [Drosera capensis]